MPSVAGLQTSEPKVQHQQIGSAHLEKTHTGAIEPPPADDDFTQALLSQTSSPAPITDNASERRIVTQNRVKEQEAQRQALLDEVGRESISESVQRLDSERFSPMSMRLLHERSFFDPVSKQALILHQPRVARVLLAAVQGGPEVREVILNETVNQLSQHIEEIKQGHAGQLTTLSSSQHQGVAFPIILSEVDDISYQYKISGWNAVKKMGSVRSSLRRIHREFESVNIYFR